MSGLKTFRHCSDLPPPQVNAAVEIEEFTLGADKFPLPQRHGVSLAKCGRLCATTGCLSFSFVDETPAVKTRCILCNGFHHVSTVEAKTEHLCNSVANRSWDRKTERCLEYSPISFFEPEASPQCFTSRPCGNNSQGCLFMTMRFPLSPSLLMLPGNSILNADNLGLTKTFSTDKWEALVDILSVVNGPDPLLEGGSWVPDHKEMETRITRLVPLSQRIPDGSHLPHSGVLDSSPSTKSVILDAFRYDVLACRLLVGHASTVNGRIPFPFFQKAAAEELPTVTDETERAKFFGKRLINAAVSDRYEIILLLLRGRFPSDCSDIPQWTKIVDNFPP